MTGHIITIGNEILIGQVVDTNSTFIGESLSQVGVEVTKIVSIPDTYDAIIANIESSLKKADVIIVTGGLGPTNDDITKKAIAKYFDVPMVRNSRVEEHIKNMFERRGYAINKMNISQAEVPENCEILFNDKGTAPGMLFKHKGRYLLSVPGVPHEMRHILTERFIPLLQSEYKLPDYYCKTFKVSGVPESVMAERLQEFELNLPCNYQLAYLPAPSLLRLRLSTRSIENVSDEFIAKCKELEGYLAEDLFGFENDTLESVIGDILNNNKLSVATAESCTGGRIAHLITSVPGASQYFKGGVIAYSNEIKMSQLGVDKELLTKFGAVSKQVVEEMSQNVRKKFNADYGISTSGIAGPGGGTEDKPVGSVWISIASESDVYAKLYTFGDNRERNIVRSSNTALNLLRKELLSSIEK